MIVPSHAKAIAKHDSPNLFFSYSKDAFTIQPTFQQHNMVAWCDNYLIRLTKNHLAHHTFTGLLTEAQ